VFSSRLVGPDLAKSVFDTLLAGSGVTMLNETYRLNQRLAAWPSEAFYCGELESHCDAAHRRLELPKPPEKYADILDPTKSSVFVRVPASGNMTTVNQKEAELAVDLIAELLACGLGATQMAVVTPFRRQGKWIRDSLRRNPRTASAAREMIVDTVERMQGQERDVILFSLVSTNMEFILRLADFYLDPRRLNVSITRAKTKLIVLSGLNFSLLASQWGGRDAEFLEDFINNCDQVDL
jgi:DNA replication ATP-dependent helicase Dna2